VLKYTHKHAMYKVNRKYYTMNALASRSVCRAAVQRWVLETHSFWGSKGQRSRSQRLCRSSHRTQYWRWLRMQATLGFLRHGFLHSCECRLLLLLTSDWPFILDAAAAAAAWRTVWFITYTSLMRLARLNLQHAAIAQRIPLLIRAHLTSIFDSESTLWSS